MNTIEINLDALLRYNITPNQYVFLFLTHTRQYAALYRFGQEGPSFSAEEIGNLVDRGLILNLNKEGYYYLDFFVLTDEVGRDLFDQNREKAALEFWNAYPILLRDPHTGENFSLLTTDKDQFLKDYYSRVGHAIPKHRRVMDALEYAIDKNLIDMTIRQWLDSEQWTMMWELMAIEAIQ
ncbi:MULTISPECIES: hypothetical protein [Spirosoma]|uniref:Uncharacterized protein n=1 Tax=Spirosoma sordidisoli TaxID=2502893 RepID=A0A4Q2ULH5_9BACT|nr:MULTISPECIES: hypothetical protein [Spirosoma]RYC69572.1 hypothetical protein EQG79_13290 [Spirosoma sordidisoli]